VGLLRASEPLEHPAQSTQKPTSRFPVWLRALAHVRGHLVLLLLFGLLLLVLQKACDHWQ
jgi:hypothetical protein